MDTKIKWEKISLTKDKNSLFHWALIHAIVLAETNAIKHIDRVFHGDGSGHRVALLINGVQVPVVKTFSDAQEEAERLINKRARELIEERVGNKFSELENTVERAKEAIEEAFGFEKEDEYGF